MTTNPEPGLDLPRLVEVLNRHGVDYLVVGGSAATLHGATRVTRDLDCVPDTIVENLERLAGAMRELNARLRVAGLSDIEAKQLPTQLDATTFRQLQISTWRTDAGDLDVLADIPNRLGDHLRYEDLIPVLSPSTSEASPRASPPSATSSPPRSGPTGPRTTRPCPSYGPSSSSTPTRPHSPAHRLRSSRLHRASPPPPPRPQPRRRHPGGCLAPSSHPLS